MFKTCALAVILATLAPVAFADQREFDFSTVKIGQSPPRFQSLATGGEPAQWMVVSEKVPPLLAPLETLAAANNTERSVLTVQSFDMGDRQFPVLLYTNEIFSDFTLVTRFKIGGGIVEPCAGVVFRAQDQSNYYVVRASTEGNLLWYKVVGGHSYDNLGIGVKMPIARDTWRELKVECSGSQFRCYLDGKLALPPGRPGAPTNGLAIDDTTFSHGKVGFWSKADTKCYFVDAHVQYTPRVPYLQVVINNIIKKYPKLLGLRVYANNDKKAGPPTIIGAMNDSDFGAPGTKAEADVIARGSIYYLKVDGTVEITLPLRDRNGDIAAALKVKLKSFKGETQTTAVSRALIVKKALEEQIGNLENING